MDGFYDQQVPFMAPPTVSAALCAVAPSSPRTSVTSSSSSSSSSSQQHRSHLEDPPHLRPPGDRKRKFVDTELAQDTEGEGAARRPGARRARRASLSLYLWFVSELFQDLSQLQELWIAEGMTSSFH